MDGQKNEQGSSLRNNEKRNVATSNRCRFNILSACREKKPEDFLTIAKLDGKFVRLGQKDKYLDCLTACNNRDNNTMR